METTVLVAYVAGLFTLVGIGIGAVVNGRFARSLEQLKSEVGVESYRSQKWWDQKHQAYRDLTEAVLLLNDASTDWYHASLKNLGEEEQSRLRTAYGEARIVLNRTVLANSYILSMATLQAINALSAELGDPKHVFAVPTPESIQKAETGILSCLLSLRAEIDLELRPKSA